MMPRLDGLGLVAALRADPRTASVPVVFLSARAGEEASVAGLEAGADDYLLKPFSAVELLARVRSNLEMARFRNRESRFRRALIDSLQEGFFVTDDEGTMLEANQAFLDLVGYDSAVLPVRWPHPWVPDPEADPEGRALMDEAFAGYQQHGGGRYTVPVRHRDGHTVWLACSSASLPGRDGQARLFVGTARDVTSERLAAQREATLAGFAAALAAAGEISDMLTTAARQITAALHGSQATIALWSSSGVPAITSWPPRPPGRELAPAVTGALAAARHQPAASVAVLPGDDGRQLLAAPLDGAGTSAVVAGFPAARAVRARGTGPVRGPDQPPGAGAGQGPGLRAGSRGRADAAAGHPRPDPAAARVRGALRPGGSAAGGRRGLVRRGARCPASGSASWSATASAAACPPPRSWASSARPARRCCCAPPARPRP